MHKTPDADALAALTVIRHILAKKVPDAKFYIVSNFDIRIPFPKYLQVKDPIIKTNEIPPNSTAYIIDHNYPNRSLLPNWETENIDEIIIIDHHNLLELEIENVKTLIDPNCTSTCELLLDYLEGQEEIKITKDIATVLYIGIFVDNLLFHTPLKENLIRKIYRLIDKYGAEVDKNNLYFRGKYFLFKKRVAEILFLCSNKSKISDTVTVKIDYNRLQRMWNDYVSITHIITEVLNTREINFTIIRYEAKVGLWTVIIATNLFQNINQFVNRALRSNAHYFVNLSDKGSKWKVRELQNKLRSMRYTLDNWEALGQENEDDERIYD